MLATLAHREVGPERVASPAVPLDLLRTLAAERGLDHLLREADELSRRFQAGRFYLAVVGQFKRGKSTLVNALLGGTFLPTGVLPVTAVVTIVEYGDDLRAVVEKLSGEREVVPIGHIAEYISEEQNPGNSRGVAVVRVSYPSPLLASGVCLVDTPGVGSVFELNTAATQAFVPKVDAALVVLGSDPPISSDELALVERLGREVRDLIFVLNKSDVVSEGDRRAAAAFTVRVVAERTGRSVERVFFTSAQLALTEARRASGVEEVAREIEALAERSGADLVTRAVERGQKRLAGEISGALRLERRALTEPVAALAADVALFRGEATEIGRLLDTLEDGLWVELRQVSKWVDARALAFIETERTHVKRLLEERLDRWRLGLEPEIQEAYRRLTSRFVDAARQASERIAGAAARLVGARVDVVPPEAGLRFESRTYYTLSGEALFLDASGWITWMADRFGGSARTCRRIREAVHRDAVDFLWANVTHIVDDVKERMEESVRRFAPELRQRLERTIATVEAAQMRATEMNRAGQAAVEGAVTALDAALAKLVAIEAAPTAAAVGGVPA